MEETTKGGSAWLLAEMAVSDHHGSGVTLCRTLGRNIEGFDGIFSLSDFHEIAPHLLNRSHKWMPFFRTARCRSILGCRLSEWLVRQPCTERWYARKCAARIHKLLPATGATPFFLVSPQNCLSIRTMFEIKKLRSVKYVTWIMDDNWVLHDQQSGEWHYPKHVAMLLSRHLEEAEKVVTISQPMGEHYKRVFGVDFEVLFAPSPAPVESPRLDFVPQRKLAYFGTLSLWPGDALARLVPFLSELGYSLDIYSRHPLPADLNQSCVTLMPPLSPDEVQKTMQKYDAVLLPIGFSSKTASYTHFNIATKMAECLGSGTMTLAIGPEHAAMMRYLRKHDVGLRIEDLNTANVVAAMEIINDPLRRQAFILKDLGHVKRHLSQQIVRQHWEAIRDRAMTNSKY